MWQPCIYIQLLIFDKEFQKEHLIPNINIIYQSFNTGLHWINLFSPLAVNVPLYAIVWNTNPNACSNQFASSSKYYCYKYVFNNSWRCICCIMSHQYARLDLVFASTSIWHSIQAVDNIATEVGSKCYIKVSSVHKPAQLFDHKRGQHGHYRGSEGESVVVWLPGSSRQPSHVTPRYCCNLPTPGDCLHNVVNVGIPQEVNPRGWDLELFYSAQNSIHYCLTPYKLTGTRLCSFSMSLSASSIKI